MWNTVRNHNQSLSNSWLCILLPELKSTSLCIRNSGTYKTSSAVPMTCTWIKNGWCLPRSVLPLTPSLPSLIWARTEFSYCFQYSKFVLSTLQHYKLDGGSERAYLANLTSGSDKDHHYFAKFLTSQKLLELQLSDSNFRRYVLVQFLILFQYLTSTVKSKP